MLGPASVAQLAEMATLGLRLDRPAPSVKFQFKSHIMLLRRVGATYLHHRWCLNNTHLQPVMRGSKESRLPQHVTHPA